MLGTEMLITIKSKQFVTMRHRDLSRLVFKQRLISVLFLCCYMGKIVGDTRFLTYIITIVLI